jgi:hypothetical protein
MLAAEGFCIRNRIRGTDREVRVGKLTDKECQAVKPKEKISFLFDEGGLYLEIHPNGRKYWRIQYRLARKKKRLSFGVYPEVSLKEARDKRDDLRKTVKSGEDPSLLRKKRKTETEENVINTFENIARKYLSEQSKKIIPSHFARLTRRLELNIFPYLGNVPINKITRDELLTVICKIKERGALYIARSTLQLVGRVFEYAILYDKAERNIASSLRKVVITALQQYIALISPRKNF